jgi:hypothetical protein
MSAILVFCNVFCPLTLIIRPKLHPLDAHVVARAYPRNSLRFRDFGSFFLAGRAAGRE